MNPYLTKKAAPPGWLKLAESVLGLVLCAALGMLGFALAYGIAADGLRIVPILGIAALCAVPVAALCWLTERARDRVHARVIVHALCMSEKGRVPYEELMKATGVNRLEQVIARLNGKGYIRSVSVIHGDVCLTDRLEESAEN